MALLNIVNNIPDANLGEHLQAFKDITKDLSPALRGDQISNFTFVRNVHNSFARKIEMLTTDLDLQQDFANSKNKRKGKIAYSYDDAPFHFIAFVPVNEQVWQLDGLNGQPYNLGAHGPQDWLNLAVPVIKSRMQVYDQESIQFALLAVTPDPTTKIEQALESTFLTIQRVHERLDLLDDTWKQHPLQYSHYNELDVRNGIEENPEAKKHAKISPADVERLSTDSTEDLFAFRKELLVSQADLVKQLKDEIASHATDEAQAEGRQYDYNPAIKTWMTMLAENGTLQELS
ncbi:MAG: hypothetical protein M4579_005470 [Chaenotheca gracillima]|nr:MAG: hypothetical protein M4579_005470 [Chaenotheca gracillima]